MPKPNPPAYAKGGALSEAIVIAAGTARSGDPAAFDEATVALAAFDPEVVGTVQAAAIRSLLEELHPDGLDADDVRDALTRCTHSGSWYRGLNVDQLLLVFSGALGMVDPDAQPPAARPALIAHATLVLAELATARPAMLSDHLALAIGEIHRAETMEMP